MYYLQRNGDYAAAETTDTVFRLACQGWALCHREIYMTAWKERDWASMARIRREDAQQLLTAPLLLPIRLPWHRQLGKP